MRRLTSLDYSLQLPIAGKHKGTISFYVVRILDKMLPKVNGYGKLQLEFDKELRI